MFGRTVTDPKIPGARPSVADPLDRPSASTPSGPVPGKQASVIGPDLSIIGQRLTLVCQSALVISGEMTGTSTVTTSLSATPARSPAR